MCYSSCIFHSCTFHPCCLLPHFLLPHFSALCVRDSVRLAWVRHLRLTLPFHYAHRPADFSLQTHWTACAASDINFSWTGHVTLDLPDDKSVSIVRRYNCQPRHTPDINYTRCCRGLMCACSPSAHRRRPVPPCPSRRVWSPQRRICSVKVGLPGSQATRNCLIFNQSRFSRNYSRLSRSNKERRFTRVSSQKRHQNLLLYFLCIYFPLKPTQQHKHEQMRYTARVESKQIRRENPQFLRQINQ